jgi:hypothetical protein
VLPQAAFLRVYEPLSVFGGALSRWAAYPDADGGSDNAAVMQAERERAITAVLVSALPAPRAAAPPVAGASVGPAPRTTGAAPADAEAYVLCRDRQPYVCPADLALRTWLAVSDLVAQRGGGPTLALTAGTVEQADLEFLRWRADHPDAVPHVRESAWAIPPSWFLPFAPGEEQRYHLGDGPQTALRYRTAMVDARRRLARGFAVLRRHFPDQPVLDVVVGLGRWLEAFHPHAWVELDYAGLSPFLPRGEADESVADVAAAVQALTFGDVATAQEHYARLTSRWVSVRMLARAN